MTRLPMEFLRQTARWSLSLCTLLLLGACGGGDSSSDSNASTGNQFSVSVAEIRVVRVDNSEPVVVEGVADNGSVITLGD